MYFLYIPVAATPRLAGGRKEVQRGDDGDGDDGDGGGGGEEQMLSKS